MSKRKHLLSRLPLVILLAIGVLFNASSPRAASGPTQNVRVKINGAGASGFACDLLCTGVDVGRNTTGKTTETSVSFFSYRIDPQANLFIAESGGGIIPNEALMGDTPGQSLKNLTLTLDIAQARAADPAFFAHRTVCQAPPCNGQCPCTGGPIYDGVITATFTKTDAYTTREHGISEQRFNSPDGSSLTVRSNSKSESSSATWTANFFGMPINTAAGMATIGGFKSMEKTLERTAP
jgi:hypothetical protein